tara:strand:- start:14663 stop:16585 length:1923 start_codon:yes stop_codon:yes gene_type:complete
MFRLITLLFLTTSAWATDPVFTIGADPIIDITGTGQGLSLGDDNMSGMKNIGFDFTFYDQTFSQVNISMNGFFTFQSNFSVPRGRNYRSETLPATSFNYSVFPAWSDFIRRSSGNQSPYIQTFGQTADTDQYFVIMWDNVSEYSNGLKSTFQAILYETTNEISFRYDELRIQNHDLTIGIQGNNEALTYMRYEDTNNTTFIETDDFSVSTAIDESFSNLSSECLIDADFSELCDVYDLTNSFESDDFLYGVDEDIIFGYDEDEMFYGYNMGEDEFTDTSTIVLGVVGDRGSFDYNDGDIFITDDIDFDSFIDVNLEDDTLFIHLDSEYDIEFLDPLPDLEEIDFLEIVEIEEEFIEHFEEVQERMEEDFLVFMEEEISEEEFVEVVEEFFDEEEAIEEEEEALDEAIDEITPEEVEEEQEEKGATRRNIVTTRNLVSNLVSSVVRGSYTSSNNNSGNNTSSVNVSNTSMANVNSPTVSNQVADNQVQTNTVLQSITIMPMPGVDNTPSAAMAEVQVTTMENQIESVTSSVMTASEADQVAEQIVSQNIQAQQEENQRSQNESGEYNAQGQANLLAFMGYSSGFNDYQQMNIPDGANWYEPKIIYANVILDDNIAGYYNLVGTNLDQQANLIQTQNMEFFR